MQGALRRHAAAATLPRARAHGRPHHRSNNLTSLPEELSELKRLRVLRLKYNQLRRLPSVAAAAAMAGGIYTSFPTPA